MIEEQIMNIMSEIEYGFLDQNGNNIINNYEKWNKEFYRFYYLLSPEELLNKKVGICWDQVELERELFEDNGINVSTYFIYSISDNSLPSHTFLTYKKNNRFYWFEHSWNKHKGIHEYISLKQMLLDIRFKFMKYNDIKDVKLIDLYEYNKPKFHIKCDDFYKYCEGQKYIDIDKMEDKNEN